MSLRLEFQGPKGRGWLMRWLPARAYENGVYYIFTNAVGVDHDTIKTGGAMILDPFGEIVAESQALGDDVVAALCTPEKIEQSGRPPLHPGPPARALCEARGAAARRPAAGGQSRLAVALAVNVA